MKARDIMQQRPITATPDMAIEDAVRLMVVSRISGLPVVDATGAVVGILSEGDLLRRTELGTEERISGWRAWLAGQGHIAHDYVRSHARRVGEVMTTPVVSVAPESDLADVVAVMESRRIKRVPVIEDGRLIGVLTRADLVRALQGLLPKTDSGPVADAELRRRLLAALNEQPWVPRLALDVKVVDGVVELLGVITDVRTREAALVLAENTPGVRSVVDHLLWIEPTTGFPLDRLPPEEADDSRARP